MNSVVSDRTVYRFRMCGMQIVVGCCDRRFVRKQDVDMYRRYGREEEACARVCMCVYTMHRDRSGGTRVEKKVRVLHNGESIIIIYYSYSYYYFYVYGYSEPVSLS